MFSRCTCWKTGALTWRAKQRRDEQPTDLAEVGFRIHCVEWRLGGRSLVSAVFLRLLGNSSADHSVPLAREPVGSLSRQLLSCSYAPTNGASVDPIILHTRNSKTATITENAIGAFLKMPRSTEVALRWDHLKVPLGKRRPVERQRNWRGNSCHFLESVE